jgi:O-antigen/teichoic acid export membrane protein
MLKLRVAIYYLEGVKGAHRILILTCLTVFMITLIGASLVMIPVSLLFFMPWEPITKAVVGIVIGAIYLIIAVITLISLLSEKRWMRLTGANDVLRKLVD